MLCAVEHKYKLLIWMKDHGRGKDSLLAFLVTIEQDKTRLARTLPGLRGFVSRTLLQGEPFEKLLVSGLADRVEWSDHCAYLSTASRLGVNSLHRPPLRDFVSPLRTLLQC